jgi:dipeptidyl aminopeptidase/acylaminoacyl peptidase
MNKTVKTTLFCIALIHVFSFQLLAQKRFELNDMDKLYTLSDPQISPDGKSILVVVAKPDTLTNKFKSAIHKVDIATQNSQQLTFDRVSVRSPRWSPSGTQMAFIAADADKKSQVFVLSMAGGEAKQITKSPTGVSQFSWKPDGKMIAFSQLDEVTNKKEIEKGYDAFEVNKHSMFVKAKPSCTHLWLIAAEGGGEAERLTSGTWSLSAGDVMSTIFWSPDGEKIAFQSFETPYSGGLISTINSIDIATKTISRITNKKIQKDAIFLEGQPTFSPDGKAVAYRFNLKNVGSGSDILYKFLNSSEEKNLTSAIDRCFFNAQWSSDSKALFVAANEYNTVSLWMQPLNGLAKKISLGNLCINGAYGYQFTVGQNNAIALIASTSQSPNELYYLSNPDAAPKKLTNYNKEMEALTFGKQETFSWKSDEFTPNGILTFPPDFDQNKKYPLVVEPHGGPRSASKERFDVSTQLKAAQGYIVFQPNYRGSDNMGYGFIDAINGDAGEGPGRDVMRGLADLKKRNYIDTSQIAINGGSYGGFMTTWLIGNYQGWKCAVAIAAVTDWMVQYTQGDYGAMYRFEFGKGKSPYTDKNVRENWIRNSPITYAVNVKTPTLLLSNTDDERVPISQSYHYFRVLQDIGTVTKFIAFPIPGHWTADPLRQKELQKYTLEWLGTYLK